MLREKWPVAFPVNDQDVRPLAVDAAREIAAVMGWSFPYTLLTAQPLENGGSQAILRYDQREKNPASADNLKVRYVWDDAAPADMGGAVHGRACARRVF